MIGAKVIEAIVFALTVAAGLFALYMAIDLFRLRKADKGPFYRGGVGQWSWMAHRITGLGVMAFLVGHIIDTFGVGFGREFYDETISLYQQWWFKPAEVLLIGAVIFHAFNGLRIILFDFWPNLALRHKQFAYVEFAVCIVAFAPVAFFMLRSAWETSPFA